MLTVGGGTGTDTINVNGFGTGFNAALTINTGMTTNAGLAASSTINFAAALTLAAGNNLTLASDTINVLDPAAIALSGSGAASLTAAMDISFDPGTSLSVVNGSLDLYGNSQMTHTAGAFTGVDLNGAALSTTGSGGVDVEGYSGDEGASGDGVLIGNGATITSTSTGTITVLGQSLGSGSDCYGLEVTDSGTAISSNSGAISITGYGSGSSPSDYGYGVLVRTAPRLPRFRRRSPSLGNRSVAVRMLTAWT